MKLTPLTPPRRDLTDPRSTAPAPVRTRQPFLRYPQPACFAPERGVSDSLHAQNLRRGQDE